MSEYTNAKKDCISFISGIDVSTKKERSLGNSFVFRVKLNEYEVEICGNRDEVLKTIEDLPRLIGNIHKAFDNVKPKKVATLTVKTEKTRSENAPSEHYPQIPATQTGNDAVLKLLETDWGKWRPRTLEELREALEANELEYPARMLGAVLLDLVKQEKIKRWNTDAGYVYILAEKEASQTKH